MCGIAGILHLDGRPADPARLARMSDAIAHRGPDDSGLWTSGPVGLAHRRLSIRDLSSAGHQPMTEPEGRVTVSFNGEIYNDSDLRADLSREKGVKFASGCDTEVLPAGYAVWGHDLFRRLEGIYAFGLWDAAERSLVLVRDHVGTKPLYYLVQEDTLYFASEIKAILAVVERTPSLSEEGLHAFLAQGYVSPTQTMLKGVRQVPPGVSLRFSLERAEPSEAPFFQLRRNGEIVDLDEAVLSFERLWQQVVEEQLVSDVPVGVLQSGGIDSTLLSYGLLRHRNVPLFTARFTEQSHDESHLARKVAEATGHEQRLISVQNKDSAEEIFKKVAKAFDGQVADASAFAFYQLAAAVRKEVKVVLSGDGADDLFGGYDTYKATRLAAAIQPLAPPRLMRLIGRFFYMLSARHESRLPTVDLAYRFAFGLAEGGIAAHVQWRRLLPAFLIDRLYGPGLRDLRDDDPFAGYAQTFTEAEGGPLDRALTADASFHLASGQLMKVDAMSMAHALEVRVPFLDTRIIDLALRCDANLLNPRKSLGKQVLRTALARHGPPPEILTGDRRGFNVPVAQLLRGPLVEMAERYLKREPDILTPYLSPDGARALWEEHKTRKRNHGYALWPILTFAAWRESAGF